MKGKKKKVEKDVDVLCKVRVYDGKHCGSTCGCSHNGTCFRAFSRADHIHTEDFLLERDEKSGLMLRRKQCIAAEKAARRVK